MSDDELIEGMAQAMMAGAWYVAPFFAREHFRQYAVAALAVVREHDRDGERWRQLVKLATQWPQTVLVVNINIGHDWHTADTPQQIEEAIDAAIAAEGEK